MRILLLITGLGMGGAERQVCDLADRFSELGHEVLLVSLTGISVIRPKNELVQVEEMRMQKSVISLIKCYCAISKKIRIFEPDVIHSHMVHANIFARLLRIVNPVKRLICTAHSNNEGGFVRMLFYRLTDRLADISTNVSDDAVDVYLRKGASVPGRMIAINNGIDTERFCFSEVARNTKRDILNLEKDDKLILAVGRLSEAKDYPNLLLAFSLLPDLSNARLAIIGCGELEISLIALAQQLGIADNVNFLGMQEDISDWMSAADLHVLSSSWEGFGLVVAEAMACERVIVATDCGGIKEVVGPCGFLVEPRNSKALADAIRHALDLPLEETIKLGLLARERVISRYSLISAVQKWITIYQSKYRIL